MDQTPVEDLLQRYSEEQILRAIVNSYKSLIDKNENAEEVDFLTGPVKAIESTVKTSEPVSTSDHPPCGSCGGTFFLRTGTCHVCQTCGTSQGCS